MKRKRIAYVLAGLALIVSATYYLFIYVPIESFDKVDIAKLPELDYCEIRNNPARYDGKVVRIKGEIGEYLHGQFFYDAECSNKSYPELLDDGRTELYFFEPKNRELYETIRDIRMTSTTRGPVKVIAGGRFTRAYPRGSSDSISDRTSFHFELFSVEPAFEGF